MLWKRRLLGAAAGIGLCLLPWTLRAQFNPEGWIQTRGWNLLFPLLNPWGASGGGAENLAGEWTFPRRVELEEPRATSTWGGVDFAASLASGYDFGGLTGARPDVPTWVSVDFLELVFGFAGRIHVTDTVWFHTADPLRPDGLIQWLNQNVVPRRAGTRPLPAENVLALATTYVRNLTGESQLVEVCAESAGALAVWVNNVLVLRADHPGEPDGECAAAGMGLLPPGVSKIAVASWHGSGPWGFRLGLRQDGAPLLDGGDRVAFLGPGSLGDGLRGQRQYAAELRFEGWGGSCPATGPVGVALVGRRPERFSGADEDLLEVLLSLEAPSLEPLAASGVSHGGSVVPEPAAGLLRIAWEVPRVELDGGLHFTLEYAERGEVSLRGTVAGEAAIPERSLAFDPNQQGPLGAFDTCLDVGQPSPAGTTRLEGEAGERSTPRYRLEAAGSGIGEEGDAFHFCFAEVSGDFDASFRLADHLPAGAGGLVGLMARASCAPDAPFSMVATALAGESGGGGGEEVPRYAWRLDRKGEAALRVLPPLPQGAFDLKGGLPSWLRLVRRGGALYGYLAAPDPEDPERPGPWCFAGSDVDPCRPERLLVGIAAAGEGEVVADSVTYSLPEAARGACRGREVLLEARFESEEDLDGAVVAASGGFAPQVAAGRLRLSGEEPAGAAAAVWFCLEAGARLERGFRLAFDAFQSPPAEECRGAEPAGEGLTLAVVEGACGDPALDLAMLVGEPGGGLGYGGGELAEQLVCRRSFAVEVDAWTGGGEPETDPLAGGRVQDPCSYHLGIDVGASTASLATYPPFGAAGLELPSLRAPRGIRVEVRYEPRGFVEVRLGPGGEEPAGEPVLAGAVEPLEGDVLLGFTAATGEVPATLEVDDLVVTGAPCVAELQWEAALEAGFPGEVEVPAAIRAEIDRLAPGGVRFAEAPPGADTLEGEPNGRLEDGGLALDPVAGTISGTPPEAGEFLYLLDVLDGTGEPVAQLWVRLRVEQGGIVFLRGDCDGNGQLPGAVNDAVANFRHCFLGRGVPCRAACDSSADGNPCTGVTDGLLILIYLFRGGAPLEPPFPGCGFSSRVEDVTLGCEATGCAP